MIDDGGGGVDFKNHREMALEKNSSALQQVSTPLACLTSHLPLHSLAPFT
jgi:hypothetical protein